MATQNKNTAHGNGTAVDTTTGTRKHIGTWTLPLGTGNTKKSEVSSVQHYQWNDEQNYATLPYTILRTEKEVVPLGIWGIYTSFRMRIARVGLNLGLTVLC